MPPEHVSNQPGEHVIDWLRRVDGWVLNVGAGGTVVKVPNVVELEYSIFRHTDLSADAHHLPFPDNLFEAVVTFNTFEHLCDPPQAAREIYRVLKPGGKVLLHTAFLQPLHEPPHHYYNATEYGVRYWFAQFDIESVSVSANFNPGYVLAWLTNDILMAVEHHLGTEARRQFEKSPLKDWADIWAGTNTAATNGPLWQMLSRLPLQVQAQFAAGFQLEARKPMHSPLRSHGRG
jgi:SAM-dependent methyltransferase